MTILDFALAVAIGTIPALAGVRYGQRLTAEADRAARVSEREDQVASSLDEMLATLRLPTFPGGKADTEAMFAAHQHWQSAWRRSGVLTDLEVVDRVEAVGQVLLAGWLDAGRDESPDTWVIQCAIRNARQGLAAFRREEELPPATFPTTADLGSLSLVTATGQDNSKLHAWLTEHFNAAPNGPGL